MCQCGSRLVRASVADNSTTDDKAGASRFGLGHPYRRVHTGWVHAIDGTDNMPAIGLEAPGHVLREGDAGASLNKDAVIIVQVDEFTQAQSPCQ